MRELDVMSMFLARMDNYGVTSISHVKGRLYSIVMNGTRYDAVVLVTSFDYYELRYHIASTAHRPTLIVCYAHDTVVPWAVLSLRAGNYAQPYELPEDIEHVEDQRHTPKGSRVLLGMYISGVRFAQDLIKELPESTRNRYLRKAEALGKRRPGRPVGS